MDPTPCNSRGTKSPISVDVAIANRRLRKGHSERKMNAGYGFYDPSVYVDLHVFTYTGLNFYGFYVGKKIHMFLWVGE